jgi:hypothetical protein
MLAGLHSSPLGEGWHNNHHAFPGSARHGLKASEIDPSWIIIRFMKAIGLVSWMNEITINTKYKGPHKPVEVEIVSDLPTAVPAGLAAAQSLAKPELTPVAVLSQHTRSGNHRRPRLKIKQ